jgi:hypothetical protein
MLHEDITHDGGWRASHSHAMFLLEELNVHLKLDGSQAYRFWSVAVVNSFWRTQQNRCLPLPRPRTETDPVSKTFCSLEYRMTGNPKPSNPKCYTPPSEPFRTYQHIQVYCPLPRGRVLYFTVHKGMVICNPSTEFCMNQGMIVLKWDVLLEFFFKPRCFC